MTHPFSDEQLGAYLDGELSPEAALQIEQAVRDVPELAERLARDRQLMASLSTAFDPIMDAQVPARLLAAVAPRPWSWRYRIAAAMACIAVGVLLGWEAATRIELPAQLAAPRPVTIEAAAAHAVYVPEVRHAVEVPSGEKTHLNRWLSKRLAHELAAPDLVPLGFQLVGGRMLSDTGTPAAQYMYENGAGERITIYVRREPKAVTPTSLRLAEDRGFRIIHWEDDQMSYAVTGALNRNIMMEVAIIAHEQL